MAKLLIYKSNIGKLNKRIVVTKSCDPCDPHQYSAMTFSVNISF